MAKKVFIIVDGKARQKERRFSRPGADLDNPGLLEPATFEEKAPDPFIIARDTKNPGEVFSRIKAGKFCFVLLRENQRVLENGQFAVIGAGISKGKVALLWERFSDDEEYARQVRFWQENYSMAIESESHALVKVRYVKGFCRFRWHEGSIVIGIKTLTRPYVFPETLVRQAGDEAVRRYAMRCFAAFTKSRKKAKTNAIL